MVNVFYQFHVGTQVGCLRPLTVEVRPLPKHLVVLPIHRFGRLRGVAQHREQHLELVYVVVSKLVIYHARSARYGRHALCGAHVKVLAFDNDDFVGHVDGNCRNFTVEFDDLGHSHGHEVHVVLSGDFRRVRNRRTVVILFLGVAVHHTHVRGQPEVVDEIVIYFVKNHRRHGGGHGRVREFRCQYRH